MLALKIHPNLIECGTDEAGRGCLAGPVTAAAVILPDDFTHPFLTDSKQLSEKKRMELKPIIEAAAISYGVSHVMMEKIDQINKLLTKNYILCGGGRKNKKLIKDINKFMGKKELILKNIDQYQIDGDFIESQTFAYIAIRSFLDLPITFPNTTRCNKPAVGGTIIKNF